MMSQYFFENGRGWKNLTLTKCVAARLDAGDLVDLNDDTVFELALEQLNKPFVYSPNVLSPTDLTVCKLHGSLNMVMNGRSSRLGSQSGSGCLNRQTFVATLAS